MLEFNLTVSLPAASLLTVILALVGKLHISFYFESLFKCYILFILAKKRNFHLLQRKIKILYKSLNAYYSAFSNKNISSMENDFFFTIQNSNIYNSKISRMSNNICISIVLYIQV